MSVKSPFEIGLQTGVAFRRLFSFENNGMLIAHRIKGRRRYTCKAIKGQNDLCKTIYQALISFPQIKSATVNPVTGSITVSYDQDEAVIDSIFDTLSHQLAGHHAQQERTVIPQALITVSNNINDTARKVRDDIRGFLNHTEPMFLSRILGLALITYGLSRVVLRGDRPAGPQLFWWGLGLLLRQTHKDYQSLSAEKNLLKQRAETKAEVARVKATASAANEEFINQ